MLGLQCCGTVVAMQLYCMWYWCSDVGCWCCKDAVLMLYRVVLMLYLCGTDAAPILYVCGNWVGVLLYCCGTAVVLLWYCGCNVVAMVLYYGLVLMCNVVAMSLSCMWHSCSDVVVLVLYWCGIDAALILGVSCTGVVMLL